jgi:ABC transporter substrate binding protein
MRFEWKSQYRQCFDRGIRITDIPVEQPTEVFAELFRRDMKELGWEDGRNIRLEFVWERLRDARLPSIYEWPETAADGGLIGYGAPIASLYRRVAVFVDKILRGANPADLPIEQPTKFELVVNLRTAHEIGIALSPSQTVANGALRTWLDPQLDPLSRS